MRQKHLAYPPISLALEHLQLLEVPAARKPAAARRAPQRTLYPQHLQVAHTVQGAHGGLVGRLRTEVSGVLGSFRRTRKFPGRALTPFSRTMSRVNGRDGPSSCRSQQPEFSAANMMSCNDKRGDTRHARATCAVATRQLPAATSSRQRPDARNASGSDSSDLRNKGLGVRAPGRTGS